MLYEVAVVEKAMQVGTDENGSSQRLAEKLVLAPTAVCAGSKEAASLLATQKLDLGKVDANRIEVLVRPFRNGS